MNIKNIFRQKIDLIISVFCVAISFFFIFFYKLNIDAGLFLYSAGNMLDGGKLYVDFIEVNPPLIHYLSVIPVVISRFFHCDIVFVVNLCIGIFGLFSLLLVNYLMRFVTIFSAAVRRYFVGFLAVVYFIFPATFAPFYPFSQREHILVMAIMPYVFLLMARMHGFRPSWRFAIFIGLLAGLGIALKIYFVIFWMAIEGYLYFTERQPILKDRPENWSIAAWLLAHLSLIIFVNPEYGNIFLWALKYYKAFDEFRCIQGVAIEVGYCTLLLLASFLFLQRPVLRVFKMIFMIYVSFVIIIFLQHKGWSYHCVPHRSFLLLFAFLSIFFIDKNILGKYYSFVKMIMILFVVLNIVWPLQVFVDDLLTYPKKLSYYKYNSFSDSRLFDAEYKYDIPGAYAAVPYLQTMIRKCTKEGDYVAFFSTSVLAFPVINERGLKLSSRFPFFWILPGFYLDKDVDYSPDRDMDPLQKWFDTVLLDDLRKHPPRLIVIDNLRYKFGFQGKKFDFIEYFSSYPEFKEFMRGYTCVSYFRHQMYVYLRSDRPFTVGSIDRRSREALSGGQRY